MGLIKPVLTAVIYLITSFYFYKIINLFVSVKNNKLTKLFAFAGLYWIPNIIIYSADVINIGYAMFAFVLIMLFFFNGNYIEKVSVVMILYPIVVALNFLTKNISANLYFYFDKILWISHFMYFITLSINCLAWLLIYFFIKKKLQNTGNYIDKKTWIMIDIICLTPLISIVITLINTPMGKEFKVYPIATACLVTNIGIIFLLEYIIKSIKTRLENQTLKLEYSYYKELEENQLKIRKLHHDMNNHLSVIYSFLEDEKIDNAKEYFSSLSDKFRVSSRAFCKNSIVNAVINAKYNYAIENQIDCFYNIDIDSMLPIDDIDLCSIIANTLDNAIEASRKIIEPSQRKITVKARCDKGYFSYCIINNTTNEIRLLNGKYLSDKPNKKIHGFGLENVKDIVEKYNGTLDITYMGTEFSVLIIIRII